MARTKVQGSGVKPLTMYELSRTILDIEVEEVQKWIEDLKESWPKTDVIVMSDGDWSAQACEADSLARSITRFIYNHSKIFHLMTQHTGKELIRSAVTRFVMDYLVVSSIVQSQTALKRLFTSEE
ncbi:hypothetical protein AMTR_s00090p00053880 [Amborella trichopoda]|uniref:Uncharacterized protein n=1 Tax=Amborella trichopoda TaxID=13333 RepID=W1P3T0_AMBTC|nr:hypothetical protein AMTR_s00090p00053880 [Amborella trichopoda]